MKAGNLVALVALGCFCTLAAFSNGRYAPHRPVHTVKLPAAAEPVTLRPAQGYSDSDRKAMDKLVARSIREAEKREKAQKIAALWNITPENINAHEEWW
jgi:hypothetical protein